MASKVSSRYFEAFLIFLLSLVIVFSFSGKSMSSDNCNYGIEEMHAYDQTLFQDSLNVIGADYSPRYVANAALAGFMRLSGMDWYEAATALIRLNYVLYAAAIAFLSFRLARKNRMLACFVIGMALMSNRSLYSLSFTLNGADDVFLGTGIPLALLGIGCVLGEKKRWTAAWIFAGLAALAHVHEGMWGGCVIGFLFLALCAAERKISWKALKGLPVFVICLFLVVKDSLLHSEAFSAEQNAAFVEIYAWIRVPHHLLPFAWGKTGIIVSTVLLCAAAGLAVRRAWKSRKETGARRVIAAAVLCVLLYVLLFFVEYLSVGPVPSATILTMYLPKCFKFLTFLAIMVYVKLGLESEAQNRFLRAAALLGLVLLPVQRKPVLFFPFAMLFIAIFLLDETFDLQKRFTGKETAEQNAVFRLTLYVLLFGLSQILFFFSRMSAIDSLFVLKQIAVCFCVSLSMIVYDLLLPYLRVKKADAAAAVVLGFAFLLVLVGTVYDYHGGLHYITGREYVENAAGEGVSDLAEQFRAKTDRDAVFLADPYSSDANFFQLLSQRTCYALFKNAPSNRGVMAEWYDRVLASDELANGSAEALAVWMKEAGIAYVLLARDENPSVEHSELFVPFVENEAMAVYQAAA